MRFQIATLDSKIAPLVLTSGNFVTLSLLPLSDFSKPESQAHSPSLDMETGRVQGLSFAPSYMPFSGAPSPKLAAKLAIYTPLVVISGLFSNH